MNAQSKQSIYTTLDEIHIIELIYINNEYKAHIIHCEIDTGLPVAMTYLYNGINYDDALNAYNQACASQSFLPDNKTSESGQAAILFLIVIVAVIVCLYVAYTGISEASTRTGNLFGYMLSRLGEVLR